MLWGGGGSSTTLNPYDELPYRSSAFPATSPLLLRSISAILGLSDLARDFDMAKINKFNDINPNLSHLNDKSSVGKVGLENVAPTRVLELGCSFGGNLIPYALYDPCASLHGIDLSLSQIIEGRRIVEICGVNNITLEHLDIVDFSAKHPHAQYDYIIAHGVYSWVPSHVREAILALISRHLAPFGVAYISFNVLPGWYSKMPIRNLMLAAYKQNPSIAFVRETVEVYRKYLLERYPDSNEIVFANSIKEAPDHYIRHEWLSEVNDALYFDEFSASLAKNGLGYLCEADLCDILSPDLANNSADEFIRTHFPSHVASELMLDIFSHRVFRRSLITHANNIKTLADKEITPSDISKLHIISTISKTDDRYKDNSGSTLDTKYEWLYDVAWQVSPASISLPQLLNLLDDSSQRLQAYAGFIRMLDAVTEGVKVDINPHYALKYEPSKTRLSPRYKGYLEYFASTDNPLINFADAFNYIALITKKEAEILLRFDGKTTKQQIVDQMAKEFNASKAKARDYLNELERVASSMYLFEEI